MKNTESSIPAAKLLGFPWLQRCTPGIVGLFPAGIKGASPAESLKQPPTRTEPKPRSPELEAALPRIKEQFQAMVAQREEEKARPVDLKALVLDVLEEEGLVVAREIKAEEPARAKAG